MMGNTDANSRNYKAWLWPGVALIIVPVVFFWTGRIPVVEIGPVKISTQNAEVLHGGSGGEVVWMGQLSVPLTPHEVASSSAIIIADLKKTDLIWVLDMIAA